MDAIEREYRVWTETADLVYCGPSADEAETAMSEAVMEHIAYAECGGCGVLTDASEHGLSIQVVEGDRDITAEL